jgi:uncharacterized protein YqeY
MSLENKINEEIKTAMRQKDSKKLEALRAIKAAILLEKTSKGSGGSIEEKAEMKILQKLVKQRKESAALYTEKGRKELADEELFQASIIETFLPEQLSTAEIEEKVKKIIENTGAESIKDMGKVMGAASKELAGKADNKTIAETVKKLLNS